MGFPSALTASTEPRVYVARIPEGNTLPVAYVFESDDAEAAGSTAITLSLTTIDGAAPGSNVAELEHDQPILFPANVANHPVVVKGTFAVGDTVIRVDDGEASPALPTDDIQVNNYFTIAGDTTLYRVVERVTLAAEYKVRIFPALIAAPADNAAVTVYNQLRLNLPSGTQFVEIGSTGVAVNVSGCTYSMAAAAVSRNTYEFRQLLGVESANPPISVETTDVATNTLTTTLKGTAALEIAVEGIHIPGDAAARDVVIPFLLPQRGTSRANESIYTRYESSSGARIYQGPGSITESDGGESINEADTYSLTMSISNGDDLEYWLR